MRRSKQTQCGTVTALYNGLLDFVTFTEFGTPRMPESGRIIVSLLTHQGPKQNLKI